jgi:hypothetical protein
VTCDVPVTEKLSDISEYMENIEHHKEKRRNKASRADGKLKIKIYGLS